MSVLNWWWTPIKRLLGVGLVAALMFSLAGCGSSELPPDSASGPPPSKKVAPQKIVEVSPPDLIQKLHPALDRYQPQVQILSPRPEETLEDNTVTVRLQVRDFPTFRDETLGLGPHLHLILDNGRDRDIYNPQDPIVLSDLTAGTHTLRVFAVYPWGESFKNDGAGATTTFHIYTKTPDNHPDLGLPLLTYNRPRGTYGAEPILLDFYLDNAPLHLVAQEDPEDEIADWRIRVTVNGESFVLDRWEPIYLKGFQPGKNWVRLEFLDELGEPLDNVYNTTARVLTYDPGSQDTLAKLVRGKLSLAQARSLVESGAIAPPLTPASEIEAKPEIPTEEEPVVKEPEIPTEEEPIIEEVETVVEEEPIIEEVETVVEEEPAIEEVETVVEEEPAIEEIETVVEEEPAIEEVETAVEEALEESEITPPSEPEIPAEPAEFPFQKFLGQFQLPKFGGDSGETPSSEPSEKGGIQQILDRFRMPFLSSGQPEPGTPATLPEIVEEAPTPEPVEELPPEASPDLVPDLDLPVEAEIEAPTIEKVSEPEPELMPEIEVEESLEVETGTPAIKEIEPEATAETEVEVENSRAEKVSEAEPEPADMATEKVPAETVTNSQSEE